MRANSFALACAIAVRLNAAALDAECHAAESTGSDDSTMLQVRVQEPTDWWLSRLDGLANGAGSVDASSGLPDLVESELAASATPESPSAETLSLIASELGDAAPGPAPAPGPSSAKKSAKKKSSSAAPAPFPPPAKPQQSSLFKRSANASKASGSKGGLAPPPPAAQAPAPSPPYSSPPRKNSTVLQPRKNMTAAQKKAFTKARKKAALDCIADSWSAWSSCADIPNDAYSGPFQRRTRAIVQAQSAGGKPCPSPLVESQHCKEQSPFR